MADGSFPSKVSATRDDNAVANPIYVQLSDGTAAIGVTGGALDVNVDNATIAVTQSGTWTIDSITNAVTIQDGGGSITVDGTVTLGSNSGVDIGDVDVTSVVPGTGATNLGKAEDAAHTSGDVGVMALAVRQDTQVDFGQDGDYVPLSIDADGNLRVTPSPVTINAEAVDDSAFTVGTDYVSTAGFIADETTPDSVDEGDVGAARMTLDRKQLMVITDATTDANRLAVNSDGSINVNFTEAAISGEIHDYDTASAIAADATSNHDYTVSNTTFLLKSVIVAGSGNIKFEVQTGPLASLATVAVGFLTGRQGDTKQINFDPAVEVPVTSTGTVRIIRTNRQGAATDLYSTIIGIDQ